MLSSKLGSSKRKPRYVGQENDGAIVPLKRFDVKSGARDKLIDAAARKATPIVPGEALDLTLGGSGASGKPGFGPNNPAGLKAKNITPKGAA